MKLVIDRKKWGRGTGDGSLLGRGGMMCCLGFLGLACGLKPKNIRGESLPFGVTAEATQNKPVWEKMFIEEGDECISTQIADRLAETNDCEETTDKQKESAIKKEFKKIGVEVVFKN